MANAVPLLVLGAAALLVVLVAIWAVAAYNRLVRLRTRVDAAWAQVDVQLKRRHSLVPNLVETVSGYAVHERATLDAVVAARTAATRTAGHGPADQGQAEAGLTQALGRLFAVAEAYPDLKAVHTYRHLQTDLAATEDKIAYARQFYNNAVQTLNETVRSFPSALVAGGPGFRPRPFFEATETERADVEVRF